MTDKFIRLSDEEAAEMLAKMAQEDMRKDGAEVAWLIRQEFNRRAVSVETVTAADQEVSA